MAVMLKVLCLHVLPLLFISGNAQVLQDQPLKGDINQKQASDAAANPNPQTNMGKDAETGFKGKWELVSDNSGVSAMHAILLPKINKVLMYDATIWRISKFPLPPEKRPCHMVDPVKKIEDCWCHSVLFDIETYTLKGLKVHSALDIYNVILLSHIIHRFHAKTVLGRSSTSSYVSLANKRQPQPN